MRQALPTTHEAFDGLFSVRVNPVTHAVSRKVWSLAGGAAQARGESGRNKGPDGRDGEVPAGRESRELGRLRDAIARQFQADRLDDAAKEGAVFSRTSYNEFNGIPKEDAPYRLVDGAELESLRRAAAGIERPQTGITLRVTADGHAIATGPKGARVPETFRRFAKDHDLAFYAQRMARDATPASGGVRAISISQKSSAMPVPYRQSGAMYFGEIGEHYDRTGKSRFARGNGAGMATEDVSALIAPIEARARTHTKYWIGSALILFARELSTKHSVQCF